MDEHRARSRRHRTREPRRQLSGGALVGKPVSRILSWVAIHLGCPLPDSSCGRNPGASGEQPSSAPLFGLAPGGACRAGLSPGPLVSSYLTVSPLPAPPKRPLAVCSLLRFPAACAGWTLSSALLCGVRTFLDGRLAGSRRASRRGTAAATWLARGVYHRVRKLRLGGPDLPPVDPAAAANPARGPPRHPLRQATTEEGRDHDDETDARERPRGARAPCSSASRVLLAAGARRRLRRRPARRPDRRPQHHRRRRRRPARSTRRRPASGSFLIDQGSGDYDKASVTVTDDTAWYRRDGDGFETIDAPDGDRADRQDRRGAVHGRGRRVVPGAGDRRLGDRRGLSGVGRSDASLDRRVRQPARPTRSGSRPSGRGSRRLP